MEGQPSIVRAEFQSVPCGCATRYSGKQVLNSAHGAWHEICQAQAQHLCCIGRSGWLALRKKWVSFLSCVLQDMLHNFQTLFVYILEKYGWYQGLQAPDAQHCTLHEASKRWHKLSAVSRDSLWTKRCVRRVRFGDLLVELEEILIK